MEYKPSKFNFFNHSYHDNDLLLYNSLMGQASLSYVHEGKAIAWIEKLLQKDKITEHEVENIPQLVKKGFLVPYGEDEQIKLEYQILKSRTAPTLILTLLPTEQCNFRCGYCYEDHKKGAMSQELQNSIVTYVRKNIHKYAALQINWFGGEPLEALEVVEGLSNRLIKICNTAKRNYFSFMTTNGYKLDSKMLHELLKLRIYTYQVTLDGLKDTHDKLRILENGEGTYDRILANLLDIKQNVKEAYFNIAIRTNFSKSSMDQLEQYVEEYSGLFENDKRFKFFPRFMGKWNEAFDDKLEQDLITDREIFEFHKKLSQFHKSLNLDTYMSYLSNDSLCEASYMNSYVIGSDGIIYKCTANFDMEENKIGRVNQNGEFEINEVKHAKWICHDMPEECKQCFFSGNCQGRSCPRQKVLGRSHGCSYEKTYLNHILDMINRKNFTLIEVGGE